MIYNTMPHFWGKVQKEQYIVLAVRSKQKLSNILY